MRQIKFRGREAFKSKFFTARWYFGGIMIDGDDAWLCVKKEDKGVISVKVDPNTVGQFTGLLDKNGTEIYDGDIIITPLGHTVIVKFGYKEFVFEIDRTYESVASYGWLAENVKNGYVDFLDNTIIKGEVIGNIHDNPELIKGDDK